MAHFGVVTPAFYSHFSTMAALAAELVDRGHRVTFLHRPDAAAYVRDPRFGFHALGAVSHPAGSLAADLKRAANPGSPFGLRRVILDMAKTTEMLCQELPAAIEALQIDTLLADQMEAAGGLVAEAMGLPFISIACALPVNREAAIPLPVMPFLYSDTPKGHKMVEGSTRVYDWMMSPHTASIEAQARRLGLPKRSALHDCLSPLAQISQTVAEFDFPRRALPPNFHHVGPLRPTRPGAPRALFPLPEIATDRPFIFASLGTMQGSRLALFKRIVRACRAVDAQVLVAHCGGLNAVQEAELTRTGADWVCAFADQQAVLARADAVVSHGGANTVIDAVVAHTPHLALPIAFDHPGGAARVEYHGVGLRASAFFSRPAFMAKQLRRLLSEPGFGPNLTRLSEAARQAGGTLRAADIIESVLQLAPREAACAE